VVEEGEDEGDRGSGGDRRQGEGRTIRRATDLAGAGSSRAASRTSPAIDRIPWEAKKKMRGE